MCPGTEGVKPLPFTSSGVSGQDYYRISWLVTGNGIRTSLLFLCRQPAISVVYSERTVRLVRLDSLLPSLGSGVG